MKKTVWTFGLISGAILSVMMLITLPFQDAIGLDRGAVIGYSTMVLAGLLIFFGIRSYRDNSADGTVSFSRALAVGSLIVLISSVCYTLTWELVYFKLAPDFGSKYTAHAIEKARASGASQAEIDKKAAEMRKLFDMYKNPFLNAAITMLEPLPVGLIITLVSAGILSRKRREESVGARVIAAG